ncbi:WRB/Get1 family, partial [Peziza echinospora]
MPSLMITILLLTLLSHILNVLAPTILTDLLWLLYTTFSPPHRALLASHRDLKQKYLTTSTALSKTSAQKEFAKWAKLRRQHDDLSAKLDALTTTLNATRTAFATKTRFVKWILTTGLRWAVGVYCVKEAVLWVPKGWVPGYVEGLLAFPRAPKGAVSVQVWGMACGVVV